MRYSVIIPYGNAGQTINECLDSVLAAADRFGAPCEVICINGGSTDQTASLIDEYIRRDVRIRHLNETGYAGPGPARNCGLDIATGDYIVFVDADDKITEDALTRLSGSDADIITFLPPTGCWDLTKTADRRRLFSPLVGNLLAWNAAYRREVIGAWRFPSLRNYEDLVWTTGMFARAQTLVGLETPWYVHQENVVGSLANTYSWRRVREGIVATGLIWRAAHGAHAGMMTHLVLSRKLIMHLILHVLAVLPRIIVKK